MGCLRAAAVVAGTWFALLVLLMTMASVLPDSLTHGSSWSTVLMLWLLAVLLWPLVVCFALRRWITSGRAGGPAALPPQDVWQPDGRTWDGDASPPQRPGDPRIPQTPSAPEAPGANARRQDQAEAERAQQQQLRRRGGYLQSCKRHQPPH
ncbi:hypothetical protein ACFV4F_38995 [Kitasatospora sp. NPDC059722]|uniref:hypothetical protein n=1 Tax=Kitasatospora sp. NPDC059722 TaxID=3346925 RepID=UPI0036A1BBCC